MFSDALPVFLPFPAADVNIDKWAAEHAKDRDMLRAVMQSRKQNMAKYLTERALERGSSDNIGVVVMWLKM